MKIIAISDTHNLHDKLILDQCDVLIHAGDATGMGREREIRSFTRWLNNQPATHKIFVPGNHELDFELQLPDSMFWFQEECPSGHILINQSITILGKKFYGSPVTPLFKSWAWNAYPKELKLAWEAIPGNTDVLITHGPAATILDTVAADGSGINLGCWVLRDEIQRVKPTVHIFGHIHGSGGQHKRVGTTDHYNVSICDETYKANQPPTEIII